MPTFGNTLTGGAGQGVDDGDKVGTNFNLSGDANVTSITLQMAILNAPTNVRGAIYLASGDVVTDLKGVTQEYTQNSYGTQTVELTFATAVSLTSGRYWIGVVTDSSGIIVAYNVDAACYTQGKLSTYGVEFTNPFGSGINPDQASIALEMYATYDVPSVVDNTGKMVLSGGLRL
jgi:hypothetical protein